MPTKSILVNLDSHWVNEKNKTGLTWPEIVVCGVQAARASKIQKKVSKVKVLPKLCKSTKVFGKSAKSIATIAKVPV